MEHNTDNNDEDDTLSLKDLQMYDQTSTRSTPRTSLTQELFDFFPILSDPTPSPTGGDILFCGKLIHTSVDQEYLSHDQYNNIRVAGSSSFRLHDRPIKRSVSSHRDQGYSHHFSTSVKKVNMTNAVTTSKWKRRMFMFFTVPEMEMSSVKGRKAPARMFPVVKGGDDRKMVAGTEKNTVRSNKVRLYSVFEKLACVSTNLTNQVVESYILH